ncbi:MAG: hypothetical protein HC834_08885 [Rhodospirillales bacterium]|nr:hypothetical protein [Rhodospirillales bacterium]
MSWPNGIPPSKGIEIAADLRKALSLVPEQRNVAIAEVHVDGRKNLLFALSGEASPIGTVPAPVQRRFTTRSVRGAAPTDNHSEIKILEQLASELSPESTGKVSLYSELKPCPSCSFTRTPGVIEQFRQAFPNIELVVTYGN